MKTLELTNASKPLSDYAEQLDKGILVLTSNDKPAAALVSLKNVDKESIALSTSPEFLEIIENARKEFDAGKTISLEDMKKEIL